MLVPRQCDDGVAKDTDIMIHDAHCHFFSTRFFEALARDTINLAPGDPVSSIPAMLGWEPPGKPTDLADRWVSELDQHDVTRVALMASAWRRGICGRRGGKAPGSVRWLVHAGSNTRGCLRADGTSPEPFGAAVPFETETLPENGGAKVVRLRSHLLRGVHVGYFDDPPRPTHAAEGARHPDRPA